MQVQRVQNDTAFGATLKINQNYRKMDKSVIKFLKEQFPQKTSDINGRLEVELNGETGFRSCFLKDELKYSSGEKYKDKIEVDVNLSETKEALLDKLVNSLKGFVIREKAQNKINSLKKEIIDVSDKAYNKSEKVFKESFFVYGPTENNDIAAKNSTSWINIYRKV